MTLAGTLTALAAALLGAALGALHVLWLRRAVAQAVGAGRPGGLLLGAPLRLLVPAALLAATARVGGAPALGAALLGFALASHLTRARTARGLEATT